MCKFLIVEYDYFAYNVISCTNTIVISQFNLLNLYNKFRTNIGD